MGFLGYIYTIKQKTMENHNQLCVWPGTLLGDSTPADLELFFLTEMGVRVKFVDQVMTLPDLDQEGNPVPGTGGRSDLFFTIHDEDLSRFAIPRLSMGIRWWEDVVGYNDNKHLYTKEFLKAHPLRW